MEGLKKRYVQEEAKHSAAVVVLQALFDASEAEKKKRAGELPGPSPTYPLPPTCTPYPHPPKPTTHWPTHKTCTTSHCCCCHDAAPLLILQVSSHRA